MPAFKHISRQNGDTILSGEWNTMGLKIQSLNDKFDEENSFVKGKLTIQDSLKANNDITVTKKGTFLEDLAVARDLSVGRDLTVTGKTTVAGGVYAGNSDVYFTKTDHDHTGIGNALGMAAIENSKNYNSLMILGRNLDATGGYNRQVTVYDDLTVSRHLKVNANISASGELSVSQKATISGGIYAASSDMYFTKTDHKYTGIGNSAGSAAIENANDFNTLMILGRNIGTGSAVNRQVTVYDDLTVARHLKAIGNITASGNLIVSGSETISGSSTITGNSTVSGSIFAANSDMYFTKTDHNHSGFGNTIGYAAIENATNYNTLMILGRSTDQGRQVGLWDDLTVARNLSIGGSFSIGGNFSIGGEKPFKLIRFASRGDNISLDTGYSSLTYSASIAGFIALGGDINEGGDNGGAIIQVYMYTANNRWYIRADFKTHNVGENWTVDVLFIRNELCTRNY